MSRYVEVRLTEEMLRATRDAEPSARVNRTKASQIDTITGLAGELAFAEWFFGDWRKHDLLSTKGKIDIADKIEIKTSAFPFSDRLNLLVREDYTVARKPDYYVQVIIDVNDRRANALSPGLNCIISGWATHVDVDAAPLRDFGSKQGGLGGYRCKYIAIKNLHPMSEFPLRALRGD